MKKSRDEFLQDMKSQHFGVEIELTGITKQEVQNLLANYFEDRELNIVVSMVHSMQEK